MEIAVIEKIKRLPAQTEESLRDAFSVLTFAEDRKSVDHYVRWIREEAKKIRSADMYELIKQTYFFAGQYSFDDFMIAMEWNREPQARFYPPHLPPFSKNQKLFSLFSKKGIDKPSWLWYNTCVIQRQQVPVKADAFLPRRCFELQKCVSIFLHG